MDENGISRRRWMIGLGAISGSAVLGAGYMTLFEAKRIGVSRVEVKLGGKVKRPFKLLQLSDLHASEDVSLDFIEKAVKIGLEGGPDIVCLTGDLITRSIPEPERLASILRELSKAAPTYACPGNHDGGGWAVGHGGYADLGPMRELLGSAGVRLLVNESTRIEVGGNELEIIGVGDLWADELEARRAFAGIADEHDVPRLLLCHNPDAKGALAKYAWDLMLSGHTHGGQLEVPFLGTTPFAPVVDKQFVRGLRRWRDRWIHVTAGVGNLFGVRFNCPPEVSLLRLS